MLKNSCFYPHWGCVCLYICLCMDVKKLFTKKNDFEATFFGGKRRDNLKEHSIAYLHWEDNFLGLLLHLSSNKVTIVFIKANWVFFSCCNKSKSTLYKSFGGWNCERLVRIGLEMKKTRLVRRGVEMWKIYNRISSVVSVFAPSNWLYKLQIRAKKYAVRIRVDWGGRI